MMSGHAAHTHTHTEVALGQKEPTKKLILFTWQDNLIDDVTQVAHLTGRD